MAVEQKKKRFPKNFIQQNPREFALLNCLRKSLFTNPGFKLDLIPHFSISQNEYKIWGKIAVERKLIIIEAANNERYRCKVQTSVVKEMVAAIQKMEVVHD